MLLDLAQNLISRKSITPEDAGCQELMSEYLEKLGFNVSHLPFADVKNIWATLGDSGPLFVFAGHTDVVPPGPLEQWDSAPFTPVIRDGKLFGRGAADMKSSIAAMLCAIHDFLRQREFKYGRIGLLITSDEEGESIHGTKAVVGYLKKQGIEIDYCLVGEASSEKIFGDTLKIGRRGSLSGKLQIKGKQGHIAYPHLADNPIHKSAAFLEEITVKTWDKGNALFQPTQFQISNIHAGTGANNIIPSELTIDFNFRYSPETSSQNLKAEVEALLDKHQLSHHCEWNHSGKAFYSTPGKLTEVVTEVIQQQCALTPTLSTNGGTSDGRFLIDISKELLELGPINESIHKVNEHINLEDLRKLKICYESILEKLFLFN
jgi:succinyl-diaminopimelate desuccinylase